MLLFEQMAQNVYLLKIPFGPVWTGVVLLRGEENILIDSGAADRDVDQYLVPALQALGLGPRDIHYLLNTHSHGDHIGGHSRLRQLGVRKVVCFSGGKAKVEDPVPYAIATRTRFPAHSPAPQSSLQGVCVDIALDDGQCLINRLRLIHTPGHDDDCVCWLDIPTGTLITGDSLQANGTICQGVGFYKSLPDYLHTLDKLETMSIRNILCGHDYEGIGYWLEGEKKAAEGLAYCRKRVKEYDRFICERKEAEPAAIATALINELGCGMPEHLFMALYSVTQHLTYHENRRTAMSKNAMITGSSHGIGAATAIALAKEGYNVGITYCKNPEGAKQVQMQCLEFGVRAEIYSADFQCREDCEKLMADFLVDFGTIDVLINNAGGALQIPAGEFEDMPLDYWDKQITLNLSSAAYCAQAAVKNMKENKIPGRIVNISSVHACVTWVKRKMLPYCAAKGGLEMFTKSLGVEVAKYGIRVNAIAPGLIMTKLADRYKPEHLEGFLNKIPVGFLGQTEHIVPAIMFLANEEATRYITGQILRVDGGQSVSGIIEVMKEDFE